MTLFKFITKMYGNYSSFISNNINLLKQKKKFSCDEHKALNKHNTVFCFVISTHPINCSNTTIKVHLIMIINLNNMKQTHPINFFVRLFYSLPSAPTNNNLWENIYLVQKTYFCELPFVHQTWILCIKIFYSTATPRATIKIINVLWTCNCM